jgi:hypothetical protein
MKCPLIDCWSANIAKTNAATFLELPQFRRTETGISPAEFGYPTNNTYSSNRLLVRDCYVDITNEIFKEVTKNAEAGKSMQRLIVSGTSGTGKTFFWEIFDMEVASPRRRVYLRHS